MRHESLNVTALSLRLSIQTLNEPSFLTVKTIALAHSVLTDFIPFFGAFYVSALQNKVPLLGGRATGAVLWAYIAGRQLESMSHRLDTMKIFISHVLELGQ